MTKNPCEINFVGLGFEIGTGSKASTPDMIKPLKSDDFRGSIHALTAMPSDSLAALNRVPGGSPGILPRTTALIRPMPVT